MIRGDKDMQDFNKALKECGDELEPCEAREKLCEAEPEQEIKQAKYSALDAMMDPERIHKEIMELQRKLRELSQWRNWLGIIKADVEGN